MATKKRKSNRWKIKMSQILIQKICESKGKALDDPYWKAEMASLLSGCKFVRKKHKNFNKKGMNHLK